MALVGGITAMVLSFADDDGALPARLAMLAMGCAIAWAALAGAGFTVLVLGLAALLQKQTGLRRTQLVKHTRSVRPPGRKTDPAVQFGPQAPRRQTAPSRSNSPSGQSMTRADARPNWREHSNAGQAFCSRSRASKNSRSATFPATSVVLLEL
jgi:hypothetical protein